jgi:hypothetical protein
MPKIISIDSLKSQRPKDREIQIPVLFNGEPRNVVAKVVNGEMEVYNFNKPIGEMLTTPAGLYDIIQKSVVDLQLGREEVPLLYTPIYRKIEDRNFSEYVDTTPFTRAEIVFMEKMELEGVVFGTRRIGQKDTVPIITYAAGFSITEDMKEYDKTWEFTEYNRAFGEAYNSLLNHIHLNPIIQYKYQAKNLTPADTTKETYMEKLRETIKNGLKHAAADKNTVTRSPRRARILVANSAMKWDLEEAMSRMVIKGTEYPAISGIDTIILYDGWTGMVGEKVVEYPGVPVDKAYLVEPGKYFRELIKHDLLIDAQAGDLKRLIEQDIVGRARRGVIASPANAVEELTLPTK